MSKYVHKHGMLYPNTQACVSTSHFWQQFEVCNTQRLASSVFPTCRPQVWDVQRCGGEDLPWLPW